MAKKYKKIRQSLGYKKKRKNVLDPNRASSQESNLQEAFAHHQAGRLQQAEAFYKKILLAEPTHPDALHNLGMLYYQVGRIEIAIKLIKKAVRYRPDYVHAYSNLGTIFSDRGKLDEAVESFRKALTLKPDCGELHSNLGSTLKALGKLNEAVASYRQALTLKPDYAEAHSNLGNALKGLGKLNEAVASYRQALTLKPDFAEAHSNLGNALKRLGKLNEAVASYRQALTLKPDFVEAHSDLLLCLNYLPSQSTSHYLDEARDYGQKVSSKVSKHFSNWTCSSKPERLCVGLVSGDFRNHPVGFFLENMLENIDSTQIDLIAYPTGYKEDELTARIHSRFVAWKPLLDMRDEAAARLIHDDGVHILLDLSGHTGNNRLPIFAWKPAPIQATWLGYFASTGIMEMDYIITDPVTVPEGHQAHFTERVCYLPDTRFCFSPPVIKEELISTPLPALRNGFITFGCFQNLVKINDDVLATWARIFQILPQARLRIQSSLLNSPMMREQFQRRLSLSGITSERVTLEESVPRTDYLAAHAHIDIILDTFPFSGGTTTCEALWMGVPTVTLAGNIMIALQGASLLTCAGLSDWIAIDEEEFVDKAVAYAIDLEKLAQLRAGLREQVLASPLFDGPQFARNFEETMWKLWRQFQAEQ